MAERRSSIVKAKSPKTNSNEPAFCIEVPKRVVFAGAVATISAKGLEYNRECVEVRCAGPQFWLHWLGAAKGQKDAHTSLALLARVTDDFFGTHEVQYEGMSQAAPLQNYIKSHLRSLDTARQTRLEKRERGNWKATDGIPPWQFVVSWQKSTEKLGPKLRGSLHVYAKDEWECKRPPYRRPNYILAWKLNLGDSPANGPARHNGLADNEPYFREAQFPCSLRLVEAAHSALEQLWDQDGVVLTTEHEHLSKPEMAKTSRVRKFIEANFVVANKKGMRTTKRRVDTAR